MGSLGLPASLRLTPTHLSNQLGLPCWAVSRAFLPLPCAPGPRCGGWQCPRICVTRRPWVGGGSAQPICWSGPRPVKCCPHSTAFCMVEEGLVHRSCPQRSSGTRGPPEERWEHGWVGGTWDRG